MANTVDLVEPSGQDLHCSQKNLVCRTKRVIITKTYLYHFDPLKPHFYIVKLGFTGVHIIFLISALKHRFGYSLKPPRRGGSNEYPQSMFWAEIWKISAFFSENFHFLVVKFSVYLNRRVFLMENGYIFRVVNAVKLANLSSEKFFFYSKRKWASCSGRRVGNH